MCITKCLKWQLKDANGQFVSALSAAHCGAINNTLADALETESTGQSGLRVDATSKQ